MIEYIRQQKLLADDKLKLVITQPGKRPLTCTLLDADGVGIAVTAMGSRLCIPWHAITEIAFA